MSKVLFLSAPAHGNVNPTLGLMSELVKQGEEIIYFSSEVFREKIETTGAVFRSYNEDLDIFKAQRSDEPMLRILNAADKIIADILDQATGIKFDYLIHSMAFPFTKVIARALNLPTVSSLAIFAGLRSFMEKFGKQAVNPYQGTDEVAAAYKEAAQKLSKTYGVKMPAACLGLLANKGEINLVYTSRLFATDLDFFDDSYKFVGPPIYDREEKVDFPFEKLQGKKVIYISLGTVFSGISPDLYKVFFQCFNDADTVVVMAAYHIDSSQFAIPDNFIVRNYVPQSEILKYTDVAITHAGMNSISDLVVHNIPFISIPLGADQPLLAKRAEELGATIVLDAKTLDAQILTAAVQKVLTEPSYRENISIINESFKLAGGYKKAVAEIFKWKAGKGIAD